jgi:AcrR family transcriptional regulator
MSRDNTAERIARAALQLIAQQGAKKSDLDEVARLAGVTRVTVYRHFGDKKGLVRAACLLISDCFARASAEFPADAPPDMDARLLQLGADLRALPQGNLLQRLDEISRLYPDVYAAFRAAREQALDRLLEMLLESARRDGTLRDDLHADVVRAVFLSAVIGLVENPTLINSNVSLADVLTNVREIFAHGILKPPSDLSLANSSELRPYPGPEEDQS